MKTQDIIGQSRTTSNSYNIRRGDKAGLLKCLPDTSEILPSKNEIKPSGEISKSLTIEEKPSMRPVCSARSQSSLLKYFPKK